MASTFSDLKIELIGTGEQVGTWGSTTNANLGTAIEEAIVGSADVAFSSSDVTLTLTDTNSTQSARHLRLNLTGTSGGARNLILGSGCQIDKPYIINNGLADTVTVKNTTGTGIAVPAGKSVWVFNNGTNVVEVMNYAASLTLGSALPVASGGTGLTSFGTGVATALGQNVTGSGGIALATSAALTSPTLTTPVLGTPSSGTLTNCTGLPIVNGTTGTLTVARGGTGATSLTANNVLLGNGTSALQVVAPGTSGNVLTSNGTTWASTTPTAPAALSTASGSAPSYSARAWVNFDGTGTPSIRASGNVSSITDIASGTYDVNFTTAMADANYAVTVSSFAGPITGGSPGTIPFANVLGYNGTGTPTVTPATSSIRVTNQGTGSNGTQVDTPYFFVAVFR
jgi:hypothetical protein